MSIERMTESMVGSPMFFKVLQLLFLGLALVSCDLKIHEQAPKPEPLQFAEEAKVNCISQTIPYFEAFLRGEPVGAKVKEFWDCNASAMSSFKAKAKGVEEGVYSAKALALFLETYFLDHMKISDSLIEEAMRLKQIFLGGSIKNFNLREIDQLIVVFKKMGELTDVLYPYMILYTGKWKPQGQSVTQSDLDYFELGSQKLDLLIEQLISWVHLENESYPMDHFLIFLKEFDKMMNGTVDFASPVEKLFPVLKKLKVLLAAGHADFVAPTEWSNFLVLGSKGYMIYMRWSLFFKDRPMPMAEQIWHGTRIVDDSFLLLTQLLEHKSNARIYNQDLFETFMKFHDIYPSFVVSQNLVDELMQIKASLLGSSSEFWEPSDFLKARQKIQVLKDLALQMLPYLDLFTDQWKPDQKNLNISREFFGKAIKSLQGQADSFAGLWELQYDWSRVGLILKELTQLYPKEATFVQMTGQWNRLFPVALAAKKILIADGTSLVTPKHWSLVLKPAINLYAIYLEEKFFPNQNNFFSEAGLSYWAGLLNLVFQELEKSVLFRTDQKILVADIENLIQISINNKMVNLPLRDTIELFRTLMQVKKSILASADSFWTQSDLQRIQTKLTIAKDITLELLPHFDIYFGEFHYKNSEIVNAKKQYANAFSILSNSYPKIVGLLEAQLDLKHFSTILQLLEKVIASDSEISNLRKNWDRLVPVFVALQNVLINNNSTVVMAGELNRFLGQAIQLLNVTFYEKYFPFKEKSFLTKTSLEHWYGVVQSIMNPIENVLRSRKNSQIKISDLNLLLRALNQAQLYNNSISHSQKLIAQLMEFKKALLGTSEDYWTAQDFADFRPKFTFIKDFVVDFIPYLELVKGTWKPNFKDSVTTKKQLSDLFLLFDLKRQPFIQLWKKSYDWANIPDVLAELIAVMPEAKELHDLAQRWETYFPVVVSAKQIITGESSTVMSAQDWESFYNPAAAIYELYLEYFYFISKEDFFNATGFSAWREWIDSGIYQLAQISKSRTEIPLDDFIKLLNTLEDRKIVQLKFDKKIIKKFGPLLLTRYLIDSKYRPKHGQFDSFTPRHFDFISSKWGNWVQAQDFVFSILVVLGTDAMKWDEFMEKVQSVSDQYKQHNKLSLSVQQMRNAMLSPQNILLNSEGLLHIASIQGEFFQIKVQSLAILNAIRALVEMAHNGYLPSGKAFAGWVKEAEFKIFIGDLVPILKELGWLKKIKINFAESRFLEGNLFTPSGDGDEFLSFQEGVELISMLISGVKRSQDLVVATEKFCPVLSYEFVDILCFRSVFFDSREKVYRLMPQWLSFFGSLGRSEFESFASYLEQGAEVDFVGDAIYVPDLMLLTNLSQYVELTFLRFNSNSDLVLDTDEAMKAFPVFRPLLTKLSKLNDPKQVRALFAYILKYGKAPEQNLAGLIEFGAWASNPSAWNLNVDRIQMAKIFSFIQSEKKKQSQ